MTDPAFLFELRVPGQYQGDKTIIIRAWEGEPFACGPNHTRLDCELRQGGKIIFPRGATWCGIPGHQTIDGPMARETVLSLFAMKPGDTDRDYFSAYTPEQLEWAVANGEHLSMVAEDRYGAP